MVFAGSREQRLEVVRHRKKCEGRIRLLVSVFCKLSHSRFDTKLKEAFYAKEIYNGVGWKESYY